MRRKEGLLCGPAERFPNPESILGELKVGGSIPLRWYGSPRMGILLKISLFSISIFMGVYCIACLFFIEFGGCGVDDPVELVRQR